MTRSREFKIILVLKLLLTSVMVLSSFAMAASAGFEERREFYKSLRYLGMGGAQVAVANDETAIAINPAGLGKLRDNYGTIFDPEVELNTKGITAYNSKAYTDPFSVKQVVNTMKSKVGSYYNSRAQVMPSFVAKNFGIAILQKYELNARATSATAVDTFYRNDLSLLMGYNLRLFEGRIKVGFTGKMISRIEVDEQGIDPTTQSLNIKSLGTAGIAKAGTGFGFDTGILVTAPWKWLPTIGVVYRDVGGMAFTESLMKRLSTSTSNPATVSGDIDVGVALFPIESNNVRSTFAIEYRGLLTQADQADKAKLIHLGYELNYADVVFFRAGYNQRYWTAGTELAAESFQLQIATYGEEIGTSSNPKEDRRWAFKLSFRF
jgi:hypothetical protein